MTRPLSLLLALVCCTVLHGQADPGAFSGLKSQLEQSLQSALAQTTVLKPRWSLPSPPAGALVRTALSPEGRALVAELSTDRRSIQMWSTTPARRWGETLTLDGSRIDQVSVTWGPDQAAWIAWSGPTGARVATWSGLAWVNVTLPNPAWSGALYWTSGLRLWGKRTDDSGVHLSWARIDGRRWGQASRTGGLRLPESAEYEVREVGGRTVLAVTGTEGGLFEAGHRGDEQWISLGFPEVLDTLPEWGTFSEELVLLEKPGSDSALWIQSRQGGWQRQPGVLGLTRLADSAPLLMGTSGTGSGLVLRQFDGDTWRVPLGLNQLGPSGSEGSALQFLPPPGNAKTGILVIGASGWELP